jgi:predicted O-linked N-acetylglucosamine transferase (SPINDLY family)
VLLEFARVSFITGDREAAMQALDEVIREHPNSARAYCATAEVLAAEGRYTRALEFQQRALALEPGLTIALNGLVLALNRLGRTREAIALIREHLATTTANPAGHSNLLLLLNYTDDIAPAALAVEHRQWNERYALPLMQPAPTRDREPRRRLRIGYVSSDFGRHSVSFFIEPVLAHHDTGSFEVYAYHNSDRFDDVTRRIVSLVAAWRDVATMTDAEVAALIRADRIDLLIDLNGHSGEHRLLAFAQRPAPVQLSYLGYPNTTGLTAMQFRISDAVADPPGIADALSAETLLRLPDCFHCYRPNAAMPVDFTPPSRACGSINFASFNVISKISPGVVDAWSRILDGVAGSTLTLKAAALAEEAARAPLLAAFAEHGIAGDRLRFVAHDDSHDAHMLRYRSVDIALDPFPYNGTTTTCDALWMGVPVVTLAGDRHAARVGASLLHAIGADALIAAGVDDYVARAIALASDSERLAELHGSLRERMRASPLLAEERFTRQLEALYREAWRRWCSGEIGEAGSA